MLAAHDAGDVVHAAVVGDHGHRRVERVGLAVERQHLLAVAARAARRPRRSAWRGRRRAPGGRSRASVVGDVDQRRDRPLARALQPLLQPVGRGAVAHAADDPAVEGRAAFGIVGADLDRAGEACRRTGSTSSGLSVPSPAAARSRAMPWTPMQSGRLGVIATSNTGLGAAVVGERRCRPAHRRAAR